MQSKTLVRMMAGAVLVAGLGTARAEDAAAVDAYAIDPGHSSIAFKVAHLVISKVRGEFGDYTGALSVEGGKVVSAEATMKAASISTGSSDRDNHLKSADFFDVAQFPEITFRSTAITADGITGDLTIHGVTKSVTLAYTVSGPVLDPWGSTKLGFAASGKINRQDFGLTWSKALETGGLVVGDEIELVIEAEFAKK